MFITKLAIQNFKKFKQKELEFCRGINVLIGPNEAGKSTVSNAIIEAFFADPARSNKNTRSFKAWSGSDAASLKMQFDAENEKYELNKDFQKGESTLKKSNGELVTNDNTKTNALLTSFLGIESRKIYESTAFIRQSDIAKINTDKDFINAIQNIVSAGGVKTNIQDLIASLEQKIKDMQKGMDRPANKPGPIKQALNKIKEFEDNLKDGKLFYSNQKQTYEFVQKTTLQIKDLKQEISSLETLLENYRILNESLEKHSELLKKIQEIEKILFDIGNIAKRENDLKNDLHQYDVFLNKNIEEDEIKLREYRDLYNISGQNLEKAQSELKLIRNEQKHLHKTIQKSFVTILAVALMFAGVGVMVFLDDIFITGLIFVPGLLLFVFSLVSNNKSNISKIKSGAVEKLYTDLVISSNKKITDIKIGIADILKKYKCKDAEDFFRMKNEFTELKNQLENISFQKKGLLAQNSKKDLEQKQIHLLAQKRELDVLLARTEIRNSKMDQKQYYKHKTQLTELIKKKEDLEKELIKAETRYTDNKTTQEDILSLEEDLDHEKINLKYYQDKVEIYKLVISGLVQSTKELANEAESLVSKGIEKYLSVLTLGRYKKARLNEQFEIEIYSSEKKSWLSPTDLLSQGTIDQVYFLLRIAFLKVLLGEKKVPLILDDPFVTFDTKRLAQAKKILQELAQEYQVIFLTHSDIYQNWGKTILFQS